MTPRQRMMAAMANREPDRVPVAPDMSNMIPCRLTGKPFWDIYLYDDPPLWRAYIDAVRHFGFDGWLPGVPLELPCDAEARAAGPAWREAIVLRRPDRIVTRTHARVDGREVWSERCTVYYVADPPTANVRLETVGLPEGPPADWEDVERRGALPGVEPFEQARAAMGEDGVVGLAVGLPGLGQSAEEVYAYHDDPAAVEERCERIGQWVLRQTDEILALKPDLLLVGISGFMIWNPEPIFRRLSLPTLQEITRRCRKAGVLSQIHCCGPEEALVRMSAEETELDNINPLEIPPMGDCVLADLKRRYGKHISLMGNLHTTEVMLHGTPETVRAASRQAIEDAAEGGGFVLSTGDQCGRDTPDSNIHAMIEAAETFGRYR